MFGRLFRWLSNNIVPSGEIDRYFVYAYPLKHNKLKVNVSLDVPQGFQVVVVHNGKITDVVSSGKHRVNGSTMPAIFQKLNLGKANKYGNYKKKFKANVYYVNLKTFTSFSYTSNNAFYLRSEKFGRIRGYSEGICNVRIDSAEEVIKFLLRYANNVKPHHVQREIGNLIGNAVNKCLEKSKLHFSDILLRPEKLDEHLNHAVGNMVNEYGIVAEEVKLHSLQLTKKIQKKVNEFLSNRANFPFANQEVGVSEKDLNVEPQLLAVEFEVAKPHSQETANAAKPMQQNVPQPTPDVNQTAMFRRRLNNTNLIDPTTISGNGGVALPNLNPDEVLNSNQNFKQCKFCNATIEMHHKYCPKCGFRQM